MPVCTCAARGDAATTPVTPGFIPAAVWTAPLAALGDGEGNGSRAGAWDAWAHGRQSAAGVLAAHCCDQGQCIRWVRLITPPTAHPLVHSLPRWVQANTGQHHTVLLCSHHHHHHHRSCLGDWQGACRVCCLASTFAASPTAHLPAAAWHAAGLSVTQRLRCRTAPVMPPRPGALASSTSPVPCSAVCPINPVYTVQSTPTTLLAVGTTDLASAIG
jgi:hypothetical protein